MDDVLMNNVDRHNQCLQKDGVPWCGAKEKDFVLLFALIQACCVYGNTMVDLTIGLGMLPIWLGQFCSNFWLYKFLVHYLQGFFWGHLFEHVIMRIKFLLFWRETRKCLTIFSSYWPMNILMGYLMKNMMMRLKCLWMKKTLALY